MSASTLRSSSAAPDTPSSCAEQEGNPELEPEVVKTLAVLQEACEHEWRPIFAQRIDHEDGVGRARNRPSSRLQSRRHRLVETIRTEPDSTCGRHRDGRDSRKNGNEMVQGAQIHRPRRIPQFVLTPSIP